MVLNVLALLLAGVLVVGAAVLVGTSDFGPSIAATAAQAQKLAPGYWSGAQGRLSYTVIQRPTPVGPAWSPELLPAKPPPRIELPEPDSFEAGQELLPGDSPPSNNWIDSPSPLGRVA